MNIHVVKHLTSISQAEREKMLRDALGKDLVLELPEGEALAMKAELGLSWFRLNKLRRLVINTIATSLITILAINSFQVVSKQIKPFSYI